MFLSLHRWLGLCAGIFLLLIGFSGSLLLFKSPIDRWARPGRYELQAGKPRVSLDSACSILFSRYGSRFTSCSFDLPNDGEVYEFTLSGRSESIFSRSRYVVDIDPGSGRILREGDARSLSTSPIHWLMYFHDSFNVGIAGMFFIGLVALSLFASMISGLLFYGRRILDVLTFRLPLNSQSKTQFFRALHIYAGVWALVFNTVVFFTGFWMIRSVFEPESWSFAPAKSPARVAVSIDSCIKRSRGLVPGFSPDFVSVPLAEGDPIEIDGNNVTSSRLMDGDASSVMFDPRDGSVLEVLDATKAPLLKKISAAFWQLHIGGYGGPLVKIIYAVGGLVPGVLSLSGYIVWWKRRRLYAALRFQRPAISLTSADAG
jgi:uncharacterized iron-regulated membrane protein